MDLEVHKTTEATTRALRSQFKTAKVGLRWKFYYRFNFIYYSYYQYVRVLNIYIFNFLLCSPYFAASNCVIVILPSRQTSLSRALHTDPILKSAMAAAALRAERGEAEPDLTRFGFAPSVGVSGREGSISGGHSKEGNEAIRRARRTATRALSNL